MLADENVSRRFITNQQSLTDQSQTNPQSTNPHPFPNPSPQQKSCRRSAGYPRTSPALCGAVRSLGSVRRPVGESGWGSRRWGSLCRNGSPSYWWGQSFLWIIRHMVDHTSYSVSYVKMDNTLYTESYVTVYDTSWWIIRHSE